MRSSSLANSRSIWRGRARGSILVARNPLDRPPSCGFKSCLGHPFALNVWILKVWLELRQHLVLDCSAIFCILQCNPLSSDECLATDCIYAIWLPVAFFEGYRDTHNWLKIIWLNFVTRRMHLCEMMIFIHSSMPLAHNTWQHRGFIPQTRSSTKEECWIDFCVT